MSRPTISPIILSCVSSPRASVPALAPSRSTTARSATVAHFPEPVRDVDDRRAPLAQGRDHLVQPARLGDRQAGGRLVHDEEPGVERQRLRNLDELLPRDRQRGEWRVRRDVQAELIEVGAHGLAHLRAVDQPQRTPARRFASEQDVAGDVEIVEQVQLLVDERDARGPSRRGRRARRPARRRSAPRPTSGCSMPPTIFISVDLPAPFSPSSATTSPACTSRFTPRSACTPGKRL